MATGITANASNVAVSFLTDLNNHKMEQDLLEAKNYLSQQGYGSDTNYTTNLVAVLLANYTQEKVKKLQQHSVMQAEGSDGVSGLAIVHNA